MIDSEKYADSSQARALDRRLAGGDKPHWSVGITPEQAAANNAAWLDMIGKQEAARKASSKRLISGAMTQMEAICGNGSATN